MSFRAIVGTALAALLLCGVGLAAPTAGGAGGETHGAGSDYDVADFTTPPPPRGGNGRASVAQTGGGAHRAPPPPRAARNALCAAQPALGFSFSSRVPPELG